MPTQVDVWMNPPLTRCRHYWRTATFKVNAAFISELFDIVLRETYDYRVAVPRGLPSCNLQLLTKHEIGLFSSNGGNAFGIKPEDGPLFRKHLCPVPLFFP
jgi:hypothetical protein